jgi:phage tail-like protein
MRLERVGMACAMLVMLAVNASAISLPDRVDAATRQDAITAARFGISIDGVQIASFSELQGIASSIELVTSDDGPLLERGTKSFAVVLRRPLNRDLSMAAWHELVILGDVAAARKSCSLIMYDADNKPVARYYLENAWPSKLEIGTFKAGSTEELMETVTMTCEFIQRVSV